MWSTDRRERTAKLTMAAIAALGSAAALAGCGGPTGTFYVVQNQVAEPGCLIPGGEGARYQGQGTLDVRVSAGVGSGYLLFPLLKNDLPAEGGGAVEPNRIALDGFDVDLKVVDGPPEAIDLLAALASDPATEALMRYHEAWSGSVAPGGGTTAAAATVFPAQAARSLLEANALANGGASIEVRVRATGRTLNRSVKSDAFTYPLHVCDGCLINSISACPGQAPVLPGGVCNPGQDALVDCCTEGSHLICPATSAP
jgi:hypothetical protein